MGLTSLHQMHIHGWRKSFLQIFEFGNSLNGRIRYNKEDCKYCYFYIYTKLVKGEGMESINFSKLRLQILKKPKKEIKGIYDSRTEKLESSYIAIAKKKKKNKKYTNRKKSFTFKQHFLRFNRRRKLLKRKKKTQFEYKKLNEK